MTNLQHRKEKIQAKRKVTPWREFVKEICSWRPLTFYKQDGIITKFPQTQRINGVQSSKDFELFRDSLTEKGLVYDNKQPFFKQFQTLLLSFPQEAMIEFGNSSNADYGDVVHNSRNVYMGYFIVYDCEDVLYTFVAREHSKRVLNSVMVFKQSENIYHSSGIVSSYNIFYSKYIYNSSDIWFSTNLQGCHHCIGCDALENKSYCIDNKQLDKVTYEQERDKLLAKKDVFEKRFDSISCNAKNFACEEVIGGCLIDSENVENGYFSYNIRGARNIMFQGGEQTNEEIYDVFIGGAKYGTHMYAIQGTGSSEHAYFCNVGVNNSNVFYGMGLDSCSYCFGCIGLKNKSYCILNKQYTKEERHEIVDQIFQSMEHDGTFGEFCPGWMSPYYFNDTASVLLDDTFTKEEVEAEGYLRRDEEIAVDIPDWMEVVEVADLGEYEGWRPSPQPSPNQSADASLGEGIRGDQERWIDPAILKKVIRDEQGNVYRIIKMEYDFLMKYELPLPRKHWLERLKGHFRVK